jgi:hypothetical protein
MDGKAKINKFVYFPIKVDKYPGIPCSFEDQSWTLLDVIVEVFGRVVPKIGRN